MNKKIILAAIFVFFFSATAVLAQGNGEMNQIRIQDPTVKVEEMEQNREQLMLQNMDQIMNEIGNPEVGEQVRNMSQNQAQVQMEVSEQLSQMSKRSGVAKFFFGPDYKNALRLRENIQKLRDDAATLEGLDDGAITISTAQALNAEADALEEELNNQLSGFSLFGWLFKLINRY